MCRFKGTTKDFNEGRFTGAIGPEDHGFGACIEGMGNVLQDVLLPKFLLKVFQDKHVVDYLRINPRSLSSIKVNRACTRSLRVKPERIRSTAWEMLRPL